MKPVKVAVSMPNIEFLDASHLELCHVTKFLPITFSINSNEPISVLHE